MRHSYLSLSRFFLVVILSSSWLPVSAAPFAKGDVGVSVVVGSGQAFYDNYTIVGAGAGYYVIDGLRLGVDAEIWFGGNVSINKISPQLQYVFAREEKLKPYVGVFYRKMSIEGFEDLNSAGARVGAVFSNQGGYYMGVGIVHESYLSCDEAVFISCSDTYPEITLTFSL